MTTATTSGADLLRTLDERIAARRKMTSPLYQVIVGGRASLRLLQRFVVHRYPIKAHWTRNILGIAARIDDDRLRRELVENIYEEETGALTGSARHLETFVDVGLALGLRREEIVAPAERLPETDAVIAHNVAVCNGGAHVTEGVASVLLLMEGQPPIVDAEGRSMARVMRDVYGIGRRGTVFFDHHASSEDTGAVSDLEDDHAATARAILRRLCTTPELEAGAVRALDRAIELRHRHFDAIHARYHDPTAPPYRGSGGG